MRDLLDAELATLDGLRDVLPDLVDRLGNGYGRHDELEGRYHRGLDRLTSLLDSAGDDLEREYIGPVLDAAKWLRAHSQWRADRTYCATHASDEAPLEQEHDRTSEAFRVSALPDAQREALERDGWTFNPRSGSFTRYTANDAPSPVPALTAALSAPVARTLLRSGVARAPRARRATAIRRARRATASVASHGPPGRPGRPGRQDDDEPEPPLTRRLSRALTRWLGSFNGGDRVDAAESTKGD